MTDFFNSIHEYKRWFQKKGNLLHDRQCGTEDGQTDGHDG